MTAARSSRVRSLMRCSRSMVGTPTFASRTTTSWSLLARCSGTVWATPPPVLRLWSTALQPAHLDISSIGGVRVDRLDQPRGRAASAPAYEPERSAVPYGGRPQGGSLSVTVGLNFILARSAVIKEGGDYGHASPDGAGAEVPEADDQLGWTRGSISPVQAHPIEADGALRRG